MLRAFSYRLIPWKLNKLDILFLGVFCLIFALLISTLQVRIITVELFAVAIALAHYWGILTSLRKLESFYEKIRFPTASHFGEFCRKLAFQKDTDDPELPGYVSIEPCADFKALSINTIIGRRIMQQLHQSLGQAECEKIFAVEKGSRISNYPQTIRIFSNGDIHVFHFLNKEYCLFVMSEKLGISAINHNARLSTGWSWVQH